MAKVELKTLAEKIKESFNDRNYASLLEQLNEFHMYNSICKQIAKKLELLDQQFPSTFSDVQKEKIQKAFIHAVLKELAEMNNIIFFFNIRYLLENEYQKKLLMLKVKQTDSSEIKPEIDETSLVRTVFDTTMDIAQSTASSGKIFSSVLEMATSGLKNIQRLSNIGNGFHWLSFALNAICTLAIPIEYIYRRARGEDVPFMLNQKGNMAFLLTVFALSITGIFVPGVALVLGLSMVSLGLITASVGIGMEIYQRIEGASATEAAILELSAKAVKLKDELQLLGKLLKNNTNSRDRRELKKKIETLIEQHTKVIADLKLANQKSYEFKKEGLFPLVDKSVGLAISFGLFIGVIFTLIPPLLPAGLIIMGSAIVLSGLYPLCRLAVKSFMNYRQTKNAKTSPPLQADPHHLQLESTKNVVKQLFAKNAHQQLEKSTNHSLLSSKLGKQLEYLVKTKHEVGMLNLVLTCTKQQELNKSNISANKNAMGIISDSLTSTAGAKELLTNAMRNLSGNSRSFSPESIKTLEVLKKDFLMPTNKWFSNNPTFKPVDSEGEGEADSGPHPHLTTVHA